MTSYIQQMEIIRLSDEGYDIEHIKVMTKCATITVKNILRAHNQKMYEAEQAPPEDQPAEKLSYNKNRRFHMHELKSAAFQLPESIVMHGVDYGN